MTLILNPKTEIEALTRMRSLPWAYHSEDEGSELIMKWLDGQRAAVIGELDCEIHTHKLCGNFAKADYINAVARVLRKVVKE